jgi:aspartate/methionine/tyrosine aminotransferase
MPNFPAPIDSRLPWVGTTLFTVMSRLAASHGAINLSQGFPDFSAPSAGGCAVPARLTFPDYRPDWSEVRARITPKTRMIVIAPAGRSAWRRAS